MTGRRRHSGFTITELLVVVAVIAILAIVGLPAIQSSLRSINRSLADSQLRVAMTGARDAAIRNAGRGDAAAVFTFDPGGRIRIVTCVEAGTLTDENQSNLTNAPATINRDIFVPDPLAEPISLPAGWSVRAYVPAYTIERNNTEAWYGINYRSDSDQGNWVFPETGFFNRENPDEGEKRRSFMVRFRSGTGEIAYEKTGEALVLLPVEPTRNAMGQLVDFRGDAPFDKAGRNALEALDLRRFVASVLGAPEMGANSLGLDEKQKLLGDVSSDTILVRPVTQLALYREAELAAALPGVRLDRDTGTIYTLDPSNPEPKLVRNADVSGINSFMVGRSENSGDEEEDRGARVFTLQIIAGSLRELAQ